MRLAAIDVGSNSIHIIVCNVRPDLSFEVIDREKDMIRLGAGIQRGRLPDTNLAAALESLAKFKRLAESHGVDEIVVAATSAVREADNGTDLITQARRRLGLRVRVISGVEEARLIHLAAAYAIGSGSERAVTIDIGGGSTEITLGTAARMESGRSFTLGVIRLAERFAKQDPLAGDDEERLVRYIHRETAGFLAQLRRRGFQRVIGTSGTIQALGALAIGARSGQPAEGRRVVVEAGALRRLRRKLVDLTLEERLRLSGLDPRRADLAAVGAVLLDSLLERLGAEDITLCDFALREGMVLDYIKRNTRHIRTAERYPDVRRRSVIELGERCGYWAEHSQQVAKLALALFDETRNSHGLGAREREWLEYGALLHDIGTHISYDAHHKHSYYLIRHGELRGFDPDEVIVIGLVARYHRLATPKRAHEGYGTLRKSLRRTVKFLGAFVRLAEGLDRSHAQVVRKVQIRQADDGLHIRLRTAGDAELEQWAATRHAAPLARLLDTEIHFESSTGPRAFRKGNGSPPAQPRQAAASSRPPSRRRGRGRAIPRAGHARGSL
ncbi:MAG TPA: Ppx/GppA phosphatase family protein [Vicinamibacterales bacterium]|nr:Ppx/GppA phosphatase family protein [Vicinamibacterales bacterium]